MFDKLEKWTIIFSEYYRWHYKVSSKVKAKCWLEYIVCREWKPIKKEREIHSIVFTRKEIEDNNFIISNRKFN